MPEVGSNIGMKAVKKLILIIIFDAEGFFEIPDGLFAILEIFLGLPSCIVEGVALPLNFVRNLAMLLFLLQNPLDLILLVLWVGHGDFAAAQQSILIKSYIQK